MAKYFNYFPKTYYNLDNKNNSLDTVTNIISRFAFEAKLKENSASFYQYEIKDSDTPEIVAAKYYNNPERHWIILLFNNIIDPQWDWPLEYRTLNNYIEKKYSASQYANTANTSVSGLSYARSLSNVQAYFKVITVENNLDKSSYSDKIEIDGQQYANLASSSSNTYTLPNSTVITETITKETRTYYDYENEKNENKRTIKLLKTEFVPAVEKEFKRVIK